MPIDPVEHFRVIAPIYMRTLLKDFPELTVLDAAAIFGNAGHESKGLTDDQEDKPTVKGSRGGLNWMQWTGPRRRALEAYAARNNLAPDGDTAAYKWLFVELKGDEKNAIVAIRRAKTLRGKVEAFEKSFLRAGVKHYQSRMTWAERALEAYNDTAYSPSPTAPIAPTKPAVEAHPRDTKPVASQNSQSVAVKPNSAGWLILAVTTIAAAVTAGWQWLADVSPWW